MTLGNTILAHERFIVFLTYLFTLNSNMQSKFSHHPQFFVQWHFLLLIFRNFMYFFSVILLYVNQYF